jgi:hypothetical protein
MMKVFWLPSEVRVLKEPARASKYGVLDSEMKQ